MLDMTKKLKDFRKIIEKQAIEVEEINFSINQQLREIKLMLLDKIRYYEIEIDEITKKEIKKHDEKNNNKYLLYSNFIKEFDNAIEIIDNIRF